VKKNRILILGLVVGFLISVVSLSGCYLPTDEEPAAGFNWTIIIFLVLIFGMIYLLMIRPQRKRQKEHERMMEELRRGDKVVTAGGIHGVVESLGEDSIVLKVESGATIRVARNSVTLKQEK
jgi:preprotein translocase subunit YajC